MAHTLIYTAGLAPALCYAIVWCVGGPRREKAVSRVREYEDEEKYAGEIFSGTEFSWVNDDDVRRALPAK